MSIIRYIFNLYKSSRINFTYFLVKDAIFASNPLKIFKERECFGLEIVKIVRFISKWGRVFLSGTHSSHSTDQDLEIYQCL